MTDGVFDINSGIDISTPASEEDMESLLSKIREVSAALANVTYN